MELTKEFIDGLAVNEVEVMRRISEALSITVKQVSAVVGLLNEGSTVPFIARYRKEATGSLDEVQVRDIEHQFASGKNLETRRIEIARLIFEQGKLTETLYDVITRASTLSELEDIYLPYKKKKKTRGMLAAERGLEGLAAVMTTLDDEAVEKAAVDYVVVNAEDENLSVPTVEAAISGAQDILAERAAQDPENRADIKKMYLQSGKITVKGVGEEADRKVSKYQDYWDYSEALSTIKPHRVLAINRGEREGKLEVSLDVDEDGAVKRLWEKIAPPNRYYKAAIDDGVIRLLSPALVRELRGDLADEADGHGIGVFSENLKNLLMTQPIKGTRVLGVDPGIRTGTKCACLDETGKYLNYFVFKNDKPEDAAQKILENVKKYNIQLIAVGNGTGTKDVQAIVSKVISENGLSALFTVVDEDGASVYSASDVAREEFPDLDLTIRGAISIGRRIQDPLAELVKIDPKSIGVGLYQHDVNQKRLSETLDEVVSSVVNRVGVNLNTASVSLLKYVSGVNSGLAKKIVKYRDEKGRISSREELSAVPGMGPKTFEQCAGFLKIPESEEALDNTWVHPENYGIAREIRAKMTVTEVQEGAAGAEARTSTTTSLPKGELAALKEKYNAGDATIEDILAELGKPGRDPREDYPQPVMQKGVLVFEDLKIGQKVTGKIKNVVDFGAFVDLGIKETALVHISEMADHYVKNPMDLVKVGDVKEFTITSLDLERRRIALSMRTHTAERDALRSSGHGGKKVVVVKKQDASGGPTHTGRFVPHAGGPRRPPRDDDGTMYNPFAAAFEKAQKGGR